MVKSLLGDALGSEEHMMVFWLGELRPPDVVLSVLRSASESSDIYCMYHYALTQIEYKAVDHHRRSLNNLHPNGGH